MNSITSQLASRGIDELYRSPTVSVAKTYLAAVRATGEQETVTLTQTAQETSQKLGCDDSRVSLARATLHSLDKSTSLPTRLAWVGRGTSTTAEYGHAKSSVDGQTIARCYLKKCGQVGGQETAGFSRAVLRLTQQVPGPTLGALAVRQALRVIETEPEDRVESQQPLPQGLLLAKWGSSLVTIYNQNQDVHAPEHLDFLVGVEDRLAREIIRCKDSDPAQKALAKATLKQSAEFADPKERLAYFQQMMSDMGSGHHLAKE